RLAPGQGIIAGRSHRHGVEAQQHLNARPRVLAERIKLFEDREALAKIGGRWMRLVLDDHAGLLRPWMLFEIRTHEEPVVRPSVERVAGAVHAEKASAAGHEGQYGVFLVVGEFQLAARQGEE